MALGDPYATLDELKNRLRIGLSDTTDDSALTSALAVASRAIDKACNRQFNDAGTPSARVFRTNSWYRAEVDDFSTTTGLVIKSDEADDGQFEVTWQAGLDYQLEPLNGVVDGEPGWPYWIICATESNYFNTWARWAQLEVTARWGWAAVPAAIKEATLIVAEETFKLKDAPFGVAGFGEYGAVRVRNNPMAWNLIAPYRRDVVLVG
jgi:hypothetical protein